jgi:hypothetical protein
MRYWAGYRCEEHSDPAACPDNIIFFSKTDGSYGIRIHDGGSSCIEINHCPWCGARLTPNPAVNRTCAKSRAGRLPSYKGFPINADENAMALNFDVTCEEGYLPDGSHALALKLCSPNLEVNVWLPRADAGMLAAVPGVGTRAMPLGVAAHSPVHWVRTEDGDVLLLIGDDDQTWDLAISVSATTIDAALSQIHAALAK